MTGRVYPVAVVGGAGFVGSNLADSYLSEGLDVIVVDNLSRPGVERNLAWLCARHGDRVHPVIADVRNARATREALADAGAVFHLAAQVAVTTSIADPVEDFEVNARGTLNVLEAVRALKRRVPVVFASTNKVYGDLEALELAERGGMHLPRSAAIRTYGVSETWPLAFSTPYGCSKGVADQYVLDHAKTFRLPATVLRMSCVYGPRQFGTEDQGWIAHFLIKALADQPITVFGDGRQVRDLLYVADAVAAYRTLLQRIDSVSGDAFNLGGGPANAVSLRMVLDEIARLNGRPPAVSHEDWRAADQLYFVADTRKLAAAAGWRPAVGWRSGLGLLRAWLSDPEAEAGRSDAARARVAQA